MPARSRTARVASPAGSSGCDDGDRRNNKEYQLKRQRNNDAVKKTRLKSKETANQRKQQVKALQIENALLEGQITEKKKNIETLKKLVLNNVPPEEKEKELKRILGDSYDEDGDAS